MNKIELSKLNLAELNSTDLHETNGGNIAFIVALCVAVGSYLLYQTAGNPVSSYNSFKAGWNAAN
ncbi:MAG: hypothetical protein WCS03_16250 [Bacteroidota bacterium]